MIPFNKPYLSGHETAYIQAAMSSHKLSGDGSFTRKCHAFFEQTFGFRKVLLTTSCTTALEMAAILLDIREGDEVIVPSYTFVSTVNAFVLRGARIVFADSSAENPDIDVAALEALITPKTKAIVPVHYAGIACDMDALMALAEKYGLFVVEDAAQGIDSYYKGRPLGSIGHLAAFSFHETKNITCGEGGLLAVNDPRFIQRAEIVREMGTNRSQFFRGEVDQYGWVDIGSAFLPSEITAAFLYAQLESLDRIQTRRKVLWNRYHEALQPLAERGVQLPHIPGYAGNNAHIYYLVCRSADERSALITALKNANVHAVFHYLSLHKSAFGKKTGWPVPELPQADRYTDCLVRLPLYYELTEDEQKTVTDAVMAFYAANA